MKRHTTEQQRYGHHERASIAVKLGNLLRQAVKPARLYWNDFQMQLAQDHADDMVAMCDALPRDIRRMHRVMVQLEEQRMRIERDLT